MKIPDNLPTPKQAPKGFQWTYRGEAWRSDNSNTEIAFIDSKCLGEGWEYHINGSTAGFRGYHYIELTPILSVPLEEQIVIAKSMVGKTYKWKNDAPVKIESWGITNSSSSYDHGMMVVSEVNENGVCVYVSAHGGQYPIFNKHLVEVIIPEFEEVVLNESYNAKVYKDKIEVGCQTFPIDILEDLVKASRKISEQ